MIVVRGIEKRIRTNLVDVLQPQPLSRKSGRQSLCAWIPEHPPDLFLQHGGSPERARHRDLQELWVRRAVPEKERKARSELHIREAVILAGPQRRRLLFEPEHKLRARQDRLQSQADARFKVSAVITYFPTLVVELHQRLDITAARRLAIRLGRQPLQN